MNTATVYPSIHGPWPTWVIPCWACYHCGCALRAGCCYALQSWGAQTPFGSSASTAATYSGSPVGCRYSPFSPQTPGHSAWHPSHHREQTPQPQTPYPPPSNAACSDAQSRYDRAQMQELQNSIEDIKVKLRELCLDSEAGDVAHQGPSAPFSPYSPSGTATAPFQYAVPSLRALGLSPRTV